MTRREWAVFLAIWMTFFWLPFVIKITWYGGIEAPWQINLTAGAIGYFTAQWAGSVVKMWFQLGSAAMELSDQVADRVNDMGVSIQRVKVWSRIMPPCQMYACAVGRPGEHIQMYRGWKLLSPHPPVSNSRETRTSGFSCRIYRG